MIIASYILATLLLISLGAFFSGSETGVYRLSRFKLRLGLEQNKRSYRLLDKIMRDDRGVVFSILIGNNLANYLVTSLITLIMLKSSLSERAVQIYVTLVMTPVLFTFSEVIPKNVYFYRADSLMPRLSRLLWFFHKTFTYTGAVGLLKIISSLFARLAGGSAGSENAIGASGRAKFKQFLHETQDEGILSPLQDELMNRLVNVSNTTISSVMVTAAKAKMLDVKSDRQTVLAMLKDEAFTRYPVYQGSRRSVIGYVNIYQVLNSSDDFDDLSKFIKPIGRYKMTTPVTEAIDIFRRDNYKMVLVVPDYKHMKRTVGLVTMKDLVEEFTGELIQW